MQTATIKIKTRRDYLTTDAQGNTERVRVRRRAPDVGPGWFHVTDSDGHNHVTHARFLTPVTVLD